MMVDEEKLKTIFLYLSKGFDWNELQFVLSCWISSSKPTIIIGDMNWHFPKNHQMKTYLSKRGFTQLIQRSTHQEGHIIDHLYVSTCLQEQFSYKVIQNSVHFSDHDIIGIQLFDKETSIQVILSYCIGGINQKCHLYNWRPLVSKICQIYLKT